MTEKKQDRRVQRTRDMLQEALVDLIIQKGYEAITVQDILDRANVGRSTFYSHYLDKEQLLIYNINQLHEFLKQQMNAHNVPEEGNQFRFDFSFALLQHVQSHRKIYRATVGKQSGALVLHHMHRMISDLALNEVKVYLTSSDTVPIPHEVVIEFVVNTLLTLITWWMESKTPCSAREVDKMFHQLTLTGIHGIVR